MKEKIKVKPYPKELFQKVDDLIPGNNEWIIQRWKYEGDMDVNDFFQTFREVEAVKEILGSDVKKILGIEEYGMNPEKYKLYNFKKEDFYWDEEGHCLKDLFRYEFSCIEGHFEGYGVHFMKYVKEFKDALDIKSEDEMIYYSTLFGGCVDNFYTEEDIKKWQWNEHIKKKAREWGTLVKTEEERDYLNENYYKVGVGFSKLKNMPFEPKQLSDLDGVDLYPKGCPFFIDYDNPRTEDDPGRNAMSVFQNVSQKTFTLFLLRESEFIYCHPDNGFTEEEWQEMVRSNEE